MKKIPSCQQKSPGKSVSAKDCLQDADWPESFACAFGLSVFYRNPVIYFDLLGLDIATRSWFVLNHKQAAAAF